MTHLYTISTFTYSGFNKLGRVPKLKIGCLTMVMYFLPSSLNFPRLIQCQDADDMSKHIYANAYSLA